MTFGEMILGSRDLTDLMARMNAESRREGMLIEQRMTEHYHPKPLALVSYNQWREGQQMTSVPDLIHYRDALPDIEYGYPPVGWNFIVQRIPQMASIETDLETEGWFFVKCGPGGRRGVYMDTNLSRLRPEKVLWIASPPIPQDHSPECRTMTEAQPSPFFPSDTVWGCTCALDSRGRVGDVPASLR